MIYYTADLHFGHKNAIGFDNRPFNDIDTMEKKMIEKWNSKVEANDDVYILGDVFYRYKKSKSELLYSLKGRLHLIIGNHDDGLLSDNEAMTRFESVSLMEKINDTGRIVILCHYPIAVWDQKHRGTYHVYGHIHSSVTGDTIYMLSQDLAFNAGCMINNYEPCTLSELEANKLAFINSNNIPV